MDGVSEEDHRMQQNSARNSRARAAAKAARIDRRPAIAVTAISILASLFVAYQLFF